MSPRIGRGMATLLLVAAGACDAALPSAAPPREAVVLVGAGDIAVCNGGGDEATAAIVDSIGGFVFAAGDNLHDPGDSATYATCYGASWGRFRDRTFPAAGNHDYDYADGVEYFRYFGSRAGPAGLGYYSVDLGAWHLVVLNSHAPAVPGGPGSAQERWLREDLAASTAPCTIALWHHPRFYHGPFNRNGAVRAFWAALHAARADVVLNGHFHLYERYAPQDADAVADATGPRQFTVGTGGKVLDALVEPAPNLEYRQAETHGVLKLVLGDGWYEWEYVAVDHRVLDRGRAECHR